MADLTNSEIRKILKSYGEDIGPVTPATKNIYLRKIESLQKEKNQPTKSLRKSEPIHSNKSDLSSFKRNEASSTNQSINISVNGNGNGNYGRQSKPDASSEKRSSIGNFKYNNTYKRSEPIYNKVESRPPKNSDSNSSLDSDLQIIADDNYRKEIQGKNLSPIFYSKSMESSYRPSDYRSTNFIEKSRATSNSVQANSNNNKRWYKGSIETISNYFVNRKENEDLMDISDCDLSDNETNLMTRLRKNYFKKTGSSDVDHPIKKSKSDRIIESSFNWNQLPNIILATVILFSMLIFSFYFLKKSQYSNTELEMAIDDLVREDDFTEEEIPQLKLYLAKLYDILSKHSGEKICEFKSDTQLAFSKARDFLNFQLKRERNKPISDEDWSKLMKMTISLPRDKLNIVGYNNDYQIVDINGLPEHITYLEGLIPKLSIFCRLKMLIVKMLNWIFYITAILLIILLVMVTGYYLNRYRLNCKQLKEKRLSELREIVSSISALLQDQLRQSEFSPSTEKYLALSKIRSVLQQTYPKLRDNRFWEHLKQFMYKSEPLIEMKETIAHGEILEWKSHLGWQGSAVQSDSQVKFEKGPTECLKIRNIDTINFDESGENYLRREVMNRIKDAGEIRDIQFLRKGSKVIVYVMCGSRQIAGRAFRKVNANYFNGNLLNVKFIRLDKYLERFPESKIYVK